VTRDSARDHRPLSRRWDAELIFRNRPSSTAAIAAIAAVATFDHAGTYFLRLEKAAAQQAGDFYVHITTVATP
jgi:hypothetical protein